MGLSILRNFKNAHKIHLVTLKNILNAHNQLIKGKINLTILEANKSKKYGTLNSPEGALVLALSVCHVSLSSKPQPVLQHLLLFNSSAVQIRFPTAEHSAWANANVLVIHDFGVMHV